MLTNPLKWHGGKASHHGKPARWLISLMPAHLHYCEPFAGGLAVLLAKDPEGTSEVVNDLNGQLMNFWKVLRDFNLFERFRRQVEAIPLARQAWEEARDAHPYDPVDDAVAFFVNNRQSLAGRMTSFTAWTRTRTRRGMNGNVSEWVGAVDGLPEIHARLRRVGLDCLPALTFIQKEDTPQTLFYCDPPYLHETRAATQCYGTYEMTEEDHRKLLDLLLQVKGKVILSGYPSHLYDTTLSQWTRHTLDVPNHAASGPKKRRMTEVAWCNF
jgi:DNA adenine methylase